MDKKVAVRIEDDRRHKLKVLCATHRVTMSDVIREAVDDFLVKHGVKLEGAHKESKQQ